MYNFFLLLSMVSCINTSTTLSMLLFLILTYLAAAIWLISNKLIYAGLLYVLVYVGAIVVLFVYVIQLVDTVQLNTVNANANTNTIFTNLFSFNFFIALIIFITGTYFITQTSFSLANLSADTITASKSIVNAEYLNYSFTSNLEILAQNLFNNYSYVLLLTVTAIILAIIGPVNLALEAKQPNE